MGKKNLQINLLATESLILFSLHTITSENLMFPLKIPSPIKIHRYHLLHSQMKIKKDNRYFLRKKV